MIVDRELVLIVSLVLSIIIILYIILVMKFVLRKARQKTKKEYDEPAATSFLDHLTVWYPRKFASTKCIPVQPRTYEELQRSEEKLAETGPATTSPDKSAGKIKFSLQYDSMRSTLMVIIHKVQLHELLSNENGDINYYVTIKILPLNHRSFQTKAVRQCKSPEFKEKFEFRVAYEKLQVQSLKMTLCCFDRFSQHEPLGDHTVHLAELEARGLSLSREILLFRDIHAVPKASGVLGELMISLGYLRLTERLTIVIIRARNLPQAEEAELDPAAYVEVSLIHESRVLKQKKTLTKDPSDNPVFNETLTFHIPVGILHQTSLLVAVKNENAQRTEDQLLGRIFLGPTATGNQFEHWNEMRINNKPIARWHKLLD
ncbi:hypothetical protein ABFA07_003741 [Porites harrisoni]